MPQAASTDPKAIMSQAESFVKEHLRECATEMIEWADTSTLKEGKLRELGRLCDQFMPKGEGLRMAQRLVEREALLFSACQAV